MESNSPLFEKNLHLLHKHHPSIWQVVSTHNGPLPGDLCQTEDDTPNLRITMADGSIIFLHDPSSPAAEQERYFAVVPVDTPGVVVCVGMGLGYTPLAIIRTRRNICHLAIFEPRLDTFIRALQAMDLEPLLADTRVTLAVGSAIDVSTVLGSMARALQLENIHILTHAPSFQVHPESYQPLHDEIYSQANSLSVGGATTRLFGQQLSHNRFRHLSAIHHQQLLENLQNTFTGYPAIIIAGGPSLNKNIHLLAAAKGKAVLIAADTVLPALLAHGVTPDFTTSIDMEDITHEKIVDVSDKAGETALICASWVTPLITKNFPARQIYWSFAGTHIEKWISSQLGGHIFSSGAGTVAHLSFTAAVLLGCSPIIFVGQDLAYSDRQDHVRQTSLTTRHAVDNCYAINAIEWVEGYGGVPVPTTRDWLSNKHHFEQTMALTPGRKFINSTEGGVRLVGTEELSLQEALAQYCNRPIDVMGLTQRTEENHTMRSRRRMIEEFERMLKSITGIEKDLGRIDSLSALINTALGKQQDSAQLPIAFDSLPAALKQHLVELDAVNDRLDKAKVWPLLDEVTRDGLQQSERLNTAIKQLADQPERYVDWLRESIARFLLINQCRRQALIPFTKDLHWLHGSLQREAMLLKRFAKEGRDREETLLDLLRLHYDNGDHMRLERLISQHCPIPDNSAEVSFYLGVVFANQSQFDQATHYFDRAVALDPSWANRVTSCRKHLAERYLDFGRYWHSFDRDVAQRLLFKGIRHSAECPALNEIVTDHAHQILGEAKTAPAQGPSPQTIERLSPWFCELRENIHLGSVLGSEQSAELCRSYGSALIRQQEHGQAVEAFAAAIHHAPSLPDLHLLHADALFAMKEMKKGMASLERAVQLDRQYAQFWENMGDNLLASDQAADAVHAYEQCFLALPERTVLIKKIGDCYLAMGQDEAAHEAYRIYQEKSVSGAATVEQ